MDVEICTVLLGGQKAHVISSAAAVQAVFKNKTMSRELFNHQLARNCLGTSQADAEKVWPPAALLANAGEKGRIDERDGMEALNHEHLLSKTAVATLTTKFKECFDASLRDADIDREWKTIDLLAWLRPRMFNASTTAVLGSKILEMNPKLAEQYWHYDSGFLPRFYGLPKLLKPEAYLHMEELVSQTEKWVQYNLDKCDRKPPEEPEWEPDFGAKIVRARHRLFERNGLTLRGRAAFDLGLLFGYVHHILLSPPWCVSMANSDCSFQS